MNTLKPCSYCGNTSFQYLPNVALSTGNPIENVLGMTARQHHKYGWLCTLVACTHCGNTLIFTTNLQQMCSRVPGTKVIQAGQG